MHLPGLLNLNEKNILPKDGVVEYVYPFYNEEMAAEFYRALIHTVNWQQEDMKMYERTVLLPRLTANFGLGDIWPDKILEMKSDIENHTGFTFNYVHLNLYRDEKDHVSWHADREKKPGDAAIIVSISLGEVRKFQLRHKTDKALPVISLQLKPGSLVIMKGETNNHWLHRIAPSSRPLDPRINLTFRIHGLD